MKLFHKKSKTKSYSALIKIGIKMDFLHFSFIELYLDQGCPTRGPLDKLVRPFLLLSSFIPFIKGKKTILPGKNLTKEVNLVEMAKKFLGSIGF